MRERIQSYKMNPFFKKFNVNNLNILLLGLPGSGKSTLINSIKTALEEKYVEMQNTFNSKEITTKRLMKFTINKS